MKHKQFPTFQRISNSKVSQTIANASDRVIDSIFIIILLLWLSDLSGHTTQTNSVLECQTKVSE